MLFMVVEYFVDGKAAEVYRIAREEGRQMPEGVRYLDSWVTVSLDRCFQLMECDDLAAMQEWIANWEGLVRFEVVPVVASRSTFETMARLAEGRTTNLPERSLPGD